MDTPIFMAIIGSLVSFVMGLIKYLKDRHSRAITIQKDGEALKIELKGLTSDQATKLVETLKSITTEKKPTS
jgi:hypothetical protein